VTSLAARGEVEVNIPLIRESGPRALTAPRVEPKSRSETLQRLMNLTIASVALIVVSPIMLVFAVLVRLSSPGPIFYSQARVGVNRRRAVKERAKAGDDAAERRRAHKQYDRRARDIGGHPFMIYKFRTMRTNAELPNGAVWATKGDARVTPVGRVMRKYRVDELPQLFNVIRGEMNIVGPRPERPSIFRRLCDDIEEYPLRQQAKPGITGWAQVNHNYDTCIEDVRTKVRYDLEYLQRQSVAEDLLIMARTLPVMIFNKGGW
jgi:lipopolysaccharide/colanic/teichoic acid biosynthesis glycosyltransferase